MFIARVISGCISTRRFSASWNNALALRGFCPGLCDCSWSATTYKLLLGVSAKVNAARQRGDKNRRHFLLLLVRQAVDLPGRRMGHYGQRRSTAGTGDIEEALNAANATATTVCRSRRVAKWCRTPSPTAPRATCAGSKPALPSATLAAAIPLRRAAIALGSWCGLQGGCRPTLSTVAPPRWWMKSVIHPTD